VSLVVDSSVLAAALLDTGPHGAWAEQVIDGRALYAPELVLVEVTNSLRRLERAKRISTPEANAAQEDLMQLDIELFPFEPFADRVLELRQRVTSYQASYVAVAETLEFPLATLYERLARAGRAKCEFLTPGSR
jgi:predicted nucleic acid-binding protein